MNEKQLTSRFLSLVASTHLEYGFTSPLDEFLEERLREDELGTKTWLSALFMQQYSDPEVLTAILRTIAHLRYEQIAPQGMAMVLLAVEHKDDEVRECAFRVCESWGGEECLRVIRRAAEKGWVAEWLDEVIKGMEAEE